MTDTTNRPAGNSDAEAKGTKVKQPWVRPVLSEVAPIRKTAGTTGPVTTDGHTAPKVGS